MLAILEAALELFPRCVVCGKAIEPGEAVALCRDSRRVKHETPCGEHVA